MKNIKNDISNRTFKKIYLLYGEEVYLMRKCLAGLKNAVLGEDASDVNYSYFDGSNGYDINELKELCVTLPFFADYRLIIVENSGLFGSDSGFADFIDMIPDTTVLVLTESKADKRTVLFKAVTAKGYAAEFTTPSPDQMKDFVAGYLGREGKKISRNDCEFFVNGVGGDMFNITTELDKLISYTGASDVITHADIEAVSSMQIENRIFDIVEKLLQKDRSGAMHIYYDLIALREQPLGILRFIQKQYMKLMLIKRELESGKSDKDAAAAMHISDWIFRKLAGQIRGYSSARLLKATELCVNTESAIKAGDLTESAGLEILLANLSSL